MKNLVSIIVPVYNVEAYLEQCLDSLLNQTYRNIEVILINDGSQDGSGNICDRYHMKDSRIKVIHKHNEGLSEARNIGIKHSHGDYLFLIDSDDYLADEQVIENMVDLLTDDVDIVTALYFEKYLTEEVFLHLNDEKIFRKLTPKQALDAIYETKLYKYNFTVAHNKLYRRHLFETISYPFGKIHEDEFTTYKLYLKARSIVFLNKSTYAYRIRENSIMQSSYSEKRLDIFEALRERIDVFKANNLMDLIDKTNQQYFYNLCYHRYMLYIKNYITYDKVNSEYIKFLNHHPEFKHSLLRFKFNIKLFIFKLSYIIKGI